MLETSDASSRNPGRPRQTSARRIELIALRRFASDGFGAVTVEDLANEAGISRRTFHRYFATKADVLWHGFDDEVAALRAALDDTTPTDGLWAAIARAVASVNRHQADDRPELRTRISLIVHEPEVRAAAAERYEAWERVVADFALAKRPDLGPFGALAVGRATLAVCRTAFEQWLADGDDVTDLPALLASAVTGLGDGLT